MKPEFINIGNCVINVAAIHSYWKNDNCFSINQTPNEDKDTFGFLVNHDIRVECFTNSDRGRDIRVIEVRSLAEREEIINKLDKILNVTKLI